MNEYNLIYKTVSKLHKVSYDKGLFEIGTVTNNGTIIKFKKVNNDIWVYFTDKPKNYHASISTLTIKINKDVERLYSKKELYDFAGFYATNLILYDENLDVDEAYKKWRKEYDEKN